MNKHLLRASTAQSPFAMETDQLRDTGKIYKQDVNIIQYYGQGDTIEARVNMSTDSENVKGRTAHKD